MRDVAVVAFAETIGKEPLGNRNEVEILMPVLGEALAQANVTKDDIDFVVSGSCDYLAGQPFSFVVALDAFGPWPPIRESHVEMDGAWALYEAWIMLQHGDIDTALVYAFGKPSMGDLSRILGLQLDPYFVVPLAPPDVALAALQARAALNAKACTEADMAAVALRAGRGTDADALLAEPYVAEPLRAHDCPPTTDGAAAIVLAAGDRARDLSDHPAWITGIDHRIDSHDLGRRDLADVSTVRDAAAKAGVAGGPVDVAELHARYTHHEPLLRAALGLDDKVDVNPSGGALAADPFMATGLCRIGHAAMPILAGQAQRTVAHATSGVCLQQNLVCVLAADAGGNRNGDTTHG